MAVAYITGVGHVLDGGSTNSSGWGLTVPAGSTFLLLAIGAWDSASGGGTPTVSFNGVSMGSPILSLTHPSDNSQRLLCWGLIAPPTGAGTFTVTYPSTNWFAAEVAGLYGGVNQSVAYGDFQHGYQNSNGAFVSPFVTTTNANGLIVGAVFQWTNTVAQVTVDPAFPGMVKRDSGDDFAGVGGGVTTLGENTDPGPGSDGFQWDFVNSSTASSFAIELLPAAAAGAPRRMMEIH